MKSEAGAASSWVNNFVDCRYIVKRIVWCIFLYIAVVFSFMRNHRMMFCTRIRIRCITFSLDYI